MKFDEAKKEPSAFIAALLAKAVPNTAIVPFPMNDELGEPVARVKIRLLSQAEEDMAFANARRYVGRITAGEENVDWKPEDLEHNARASEILSVACRKEDGSPFFEHGVIDTRQFATDILGQLMFTYARLKEDCFPALRDMSPEEVDKWIGIIAEGALDYPFSFFSRTKLEAFCDSLVMRLAEREETSESPTESSSGGSKEPTGS